MNHDRWKISCTEPLLCDACALGRWRATRIILMIGNPKAGLWRKRKTILRRKKHGGHFCPYRRESQAFFACRENVAKKTGDPSGTAIEKELTKFSCEHQSKLFSYTIYRNKFIIFLIYMITRYNT